MSAGALSPKQFYTENNIISQSEDKDALINRVRGIQNKTSNLYMPSFSSDYTTVHSMPSGTAFGGHSVGGVEDMEDEEA